MTDVRIKNPTYTGKALKPKVTVIMSDGSSLKEGKDYKVKYSNNKNVGTASATITGIGAYEGTIVALFWILPKGTTVSKLTAAKKGFTVKWKKQKTQTSGYQIQYSLNKNFKKGNKTVTVRGVKATTKKIAKLKAKKKYYVRVRTYRTVKGLTYFSTWSKAKAVTTKK